ncbi:hypothetical protein MTBGP_23110 [Moorella thermoacetica]|uniref:DUF4380 domain-containing protein n=1 Tax=Neomoorella thermoacetica TaxID=1525 RepID=UPI0030D5DD70
MNPCWWREIDFRGWNGAVEFGNDLIRVVMVPTLGGRIMAYDLGDYSFLYVNKELEGKLFTPEENYGDGSIAAWKNYGGDKTWPAPQGWDTEEEWHGPPDPVLDSGVYTGRWLECSPEKVSYEVESPPDPRTGIKLFRKVTIRQDSSKLWLELRMKNISSRPVAWSIWNVTQLDTRLRNGKGYDPNCRLYIPLNPVSRFAKGYRVIFGEEDNPQWGQREGNDLLVIPYLFYVGKIGVDSPVGWMAFVNDTEGYTWCLRYPYYPEEKDAYPDGGCSVECWTVGRGVVTGKDYSQETGYHIEAEVLGPVRKLKPGEEQFLELEMGVAKGGGRFKKVTAGGYIIMGGGARLEKGKLIINLSGGVFYKGRLQVVVTDARHNVIWQQDLGEVSPHEEVKVDQKIDLPFSRVVFPSLQAHLIIDHPGGMDEYYLAYL